MEPDKRSNRHHPDPEPIPSTEPPEGLGLSVERSEGRLVITWAGRSWWRGGGPWLGIIGIGLLGIASLRLHEHMPSVFRTTCFATFGAAALLAAWGFGQRAIVFEVTEGTLYIRRRAPLFTWTTTYSPGQVRDIRLDSDPAEGYNNYGAKRLLRIQDVHYDRHDYLLNHPRAGVEWIGQTLRLSRICRGATLPRGLNRDW